MPTKWHIQLAALPPTCARKRSEERDPKSEAMYIRLGRPISSAGHKKITHRKMGLQHRGRLLDPLHFAGIACESNCIQECGIDGDGYRDNTDDPEQQNSPDRP